MDKFDNLIDESPFAHSPVMPQMLDESTVIQFRCRKGIECWNACCSNIDISLTPVDILRLSRRLGISTTEFIQQYTFPYELEPNGIAGIKFRPSRSLSSSFRLRKSPWKNSLYVSSAVSRAYYGLSCSK